jgi:hypothetical protein
MRALTEGGEAFVAHVGHEPARHAPDVQHRLGGGEPLLRPGLAHLPLERLGVTNRKSGTENILRV